MDIYLPIAEVSLDIFVLLGLGATQAAAGVMRHRLAVFNWLQASFRLAQLVAHHSARSGPAIRAQLSTGEVVATVSNDAMRARAQFVEQIPGGASQQADDDFAIGQRRVVVRYLA